MSYLFLQFPEEILAGILWYLDDSDITTVALLCRKLDRIATEVVKKRYNGETSNAFYKIEIFRLSVEADVYEVEQHHPYILGRVSAILMKLHVHMPDINHWLYRVIDKFGANVRRLIIQSQRLNTTIRVRLNDIIMKMPNICYLELKRVFSTGRTWLNRQYVHLKQFVLALNQNLQKDCLRKFLRYNVQLETFTLMTTRFELVEALDRSNLVNLDVRIADAGRFDPVVSIQLVHMKNLVKVWLFIPNNSVNACIQTIVAYCPRLEHLHLDCNEQDNLTDKSINILCNLRSLGTFNAHFAMSLQNAVKLLTGIPNLNIFRFRKNEFQADEFRKTLLPAANQNASLKTIGVADYRFSIWKNKFLDKLMTDLNDSIHIDIEIRSGYKLLVSKDEIKLNLGNMGVTIKSSNNRLTPYDSKSRELEFIRNAVRDCHELEEYLSRHTLVQALFSDMKNKTLDLRCDITKDFVKLLGDSVVKSTAELSFLHLNMVKKITWLEEHCQNLRELRFIISRNSTDLPEWSFKKLKRLVIDTTTTENFTFDLSFFRGFRSCYLTTLKFWGSHTIELENIEVFRDIPTFNHLHTLHILNFNRSMNDLLVLFKEKTLETLRQLILVNQIAEAGRYKMNNKTTTAISRFTNIVTLKLILPGIEECNTKILFEKCKKLSELAFECNFLFEDPVTRYQIFHEIRSADFSLQTLRLVWNDMMIDGTALPLLKNWLPRVDIKMIQINEKLNTTAELRAKGHTGFDPLVSTSETE